MSLKLLSAFSLSMGAKKNKYRNEVWLWRDRASVMVNGSDILAKDTTNEYAYALRSVMTDLYRNSVDANILFWYMKNRSDNDEHLSLFQHKTNVLRILDCSANAYPTDIAQSFKT